MSYSRNESTSFEHIKTIITKTFENYLEDFKNFLKDNSPELLKFFDEFRKFVLNVLPDIVIYTNRNVSKSVRELLLFETSLRRYKTQVMRNIFVAWLRIKYNVQLNILQKRYKIINGYGGIWKWEKRIILYMREKNLLTI